VCDPDPIDTTGRMRGQMNTQTIELARLATLEPGPQRDKLTVGLADMLAAQRLQDLDTSNALGDLLRNLVVAASRDLRMRVAAKLANVEWAPHELVMALALDEIDVAEPVIRLSVVLNDDDLVEVARHGGHGHRKVLAQRADIGMCVCDALTELREADVIADLLANLTAQLSRSALQTCLELARDHEIVHAPLAARRDLPTEIVEAAYLMLGDELRACISANYDIDEASLRRVLSAATAEAAVQNDADAQDAEQDGNAKRDTEAYALTSSLHRSGALTGEFVTRSAIEGRVEVFEHAVAFVADIDVDEVRAALKAKGAWAVALACRAADVRKQSVIAIYRVLANAGRVAPGVSAEAERTADNTFTSQSPTGAADALRRIAHSG